MGASEESEPLYVSVGPGRFVNIDNQFTYHAPTPEQIPLYTAIRDMGGTLAALIAQLCPPCPDRTTALNKVRESVMWANASIATYEAEWPPPIAPPEPTDG